MNTSLADQNADAYQKSVDLSLATFQSSRSDRIRRFRQTEPVVRPMVVQSVISIVLCTPVDVALSMYALPNLIQEELT
jgi:hypothetical protein